MSGELADRLRKAWSDYVRREMARDPSLAPDDIKQEDVAARVAKRLGEPFTASTFSKIKSGRQEPYARQLAAIAVEIGADHAWLVGVKGIAPDTRHRPKKPAGEREA